MWVNFRPEATVSTEYTTIYATVGQGIAYSLEGIEPADMEGDSHTREVRDDRNYKLLLWANG